MRLKPIKNMDELYNHYNKFLFDNSLPSSFINFSGRNQKACQTHGTKAKRFDEIIRTNEIILPSSLLGLSDIDMHAGLVHQMAHIWQYYYGDSTKRSYHNRQWIEKMHSIGIEPHDKGASAGAGQKILENGKFKSAFSNIDTSELNKFLGTYSTLLYNSKDIKEPEKKKRHYKKKIEYTCNCNSIFSTALLNCQCLDCNQLYAPKSESKQQKTDMQYKPT